MSNDPLELRMDYENGLISDFLGGRWAVTKGNKRGRAVDISEEREARKLLAERLRIMSGCLPSDTNQRILWRLAAMIKDPAPAGELWKLVIKPHGRLSKDLRDREIAWCVACWRESSREECKNLKWAVDQVEKRYGVKQRTILSAWSKYGAEAEADLRKIHTPDFPKLGSPSDRRRWRSDETDDE